MTVMRRILTLMSTEQAAGAVPAFTLGWRMRRALDHADIEVADMADQLGVDRKTVSRWLNERYTRPPAKVILRAWASITGVDYEWLTTGVATYPTDPTAATKGRKGQPTRPKGATSHRVLTPTLSTNRLMYPVAA